jgi:hypothetical protein
MGSEPDRGVLPRGVSHKKQPFTRILFFLLLLGSPLRTQSQRHLSALDTLLRVAPRRVEYIAASDRVEWLHGQSG